MQSKNAQKPRRKYDASFKAEVVSMIASGRPVPEIARSLGIGENIIYRWRKKALDSSQTTAEATVSSTPSQVSLAEHLALQKRLREVEMKRDILKKLWASSHGHNSRALRLYQAAGRALSHSGVV